MGVAKGLGWPKNRVMTPEEWKAIVSDANPVNETVQFVDLYEDSLRDRPGLIGQWPAYNFYAQVIYHLEQFHALVMCNGTERGVYSSETVAGLRATVCSEFGCE